MFHRHFLKSSSPPKPAKKIYLFSPRGSAGVATLRNLGWGHRILRREPMAEHLTQVALEKPRCSGHLHRHFDNEVKPTGFYTELALRPHSGRAQGDETEPRSRFSQILADSCRFLVFFLENEAFGKRRFQIPQETVGKCRKLQKKPQIGVCDNPP